MTHWFKEWRQDNGVTRASWSERISFSDGAGGSATITCWQTPGGPVLEQVGPNGIHEVWVPAGGGSNSVYLAERDLDVYIGKLPKPDAVICDDCDGVGLDEQGHNCNACDGFGFKGITP